MAVLISKGRRQGFVIFAWQWPSYITLDSKVRGANMGPIWGRQDPGGPHVGPMNLAIWGTFVVKGKLS